MPRTVTKCPICGHRYGVKIEELELKTTEELSGDLVELSSTLMEKYEDLKSSHDLTIKHLEDVTMQKFDLAEANNTYKNVLIRLISLTEDAKKLLLPDI